MNKCVTILVLYGLITTSFLGHQKDKQNDVSYSNHEDLLSNVINDTQQFPVKENSIYEIVRNIDLKNQTYLIPKGVTLVARGGLIMHGSLIGDGTKIISNDCIFDNVFIMGTWDVEHISTSLFKNLTMENSLQNLFALAADNVDNTIFIDKGNYQVSASQKNQKVLNVPSRTEVILNGTITMSPNNLTNYNILYLNGSDIRVHGRGSIVGDKFSHIGAAGEWGMGINLYQCSNVSIYDLTIKDCWGDCIYVGGKSSNVTINNCLLDNGRRQGISITSGSNIQIDNCTIKNVSGAAPQYAIDVEPNKGDTVTNVIINHVTAIDCVGGFLVYGKAKNAHIRNITINGCTVRGTIEKYPVGLLYADEVSFYNNLIFSDSDYAVLAQEIDGFTAVDNIIAAKGKKPINIISCERKKVRNYGTREQ